MQARWAFRLQWWQRMSLQALIATAAMLPDLGLQALAAAREAGQPQEGAADDNEDALDEDDY